MAKTQKIYMHKVTGDIKFVSKSEGKKLGSEYTLVQFIANDKGERVKRYSVDHFTIDIQPNGEREVVKQDGNKRPE